MLKATQARLDSLENDNDADEPLAAESGDEEFVLLSEGEEGELLFSKF